MGKDRFYGYSEKDIFSLIEKDIALKKLEKYRDALAIFIEEIQGTKLKISAIIEGRDGAGKGSTIDKSKKYVKPTAVNTIALPKPTSEERLLDAFFNRYAQYFPKDGQITFFDRSWYNRALVEVVMGFATEEEYKVFLENVINFELNSMSERGMNIIKIYLSVSRAEQIRRLKNRSLHIRKNWKKSPIDKQAIKKRALYTEAKQRMLEATHRTSSPWHIIRSDDRFTSTIEVIKLIINSYPDIAERVLQKIDIDLSMNDEVYSTGYQELQKMWGSGRVRKKLRFKNST